MPPFYDIYGISKFRDKVTINSFLDFYCYRDKIEDIPGQEIAIYKNEKYNTEEEFIPVGSLNEVIDYGITNINKGFAFYIGSKNDYKRDIKGVILKFTFDNKIIFGISIEEKQVIDNRLVDNYKKALLIEQEIKNLTSSTKTSIEIEFAPADDEDEFNSNAGLWNETIKTIK